MADPQVSDAAAPDSATGSSVTLSRTPAVAHAAVPLAAPAVTATVPPVVSNLVFGLLTEVFSVVNTVITPNSAVPLTNPLQLLVFEVVRRFEMDFGLPVAGTPPVGPSGPVSASPGLPSPGDVIPTPYGGIGKWLLQPDGQISDFGGQQLGGKTLLEPVNVIIIDPTSTTPEQAAAKLNANLSQAGFPAQPVHTTGFQGIIDGVTFGQQPTGILEAFADNFFLLPEDHARVFGPAPAQDGTGYVWTVAASREQVGLYGLLLTHTYVSFDAARDELANRLVLNGATLVGEVPLGNSYDDGTTTTGDHDGYALVVQLNN
jgi:hypothetical protein